MADIVDETHPVVAGLSGGYRYTRPEADGEYKLHPGDYLFLIYYERNDPEQESGQLLNGNYGTYCRAFILPRVQLVGTHPSENFSSLNILCRIVINYALKLFII